MVRDHQNVRHEATSLVDRHLRAMDDAVVRDMIDQGARILGEEPVDRQRSLVISALKSLLGFHLRMSNVALQRDFMQATASFGLTQKQTGVMILVGENPGVSQVDLAAVLLTDRATMMGMVDRLEKRGLVVRKRSTDDRRRQELYLSSEGESFRREMGAAITEHEKRFTDLFTPTEIVQLKGFLHRLYSG